MKKKTMTMVVYEMVPDRTVFYILDNEDVEKMELRPLLQACNGKFVNSDEFTEEMDALTRILGKEQLKEKIVQTPVVGVNITEVYLFGLIM